MRNPRRGSAGAGRTRPGRGTPTVAAVRRAYRQKAADFVRWCRCYRPDDMFRRARSRFRAWRHPVVEIEGIRLYRGSGLTARVLQVLETGQYEKPEARIVRHAIEPDDVVLELGTGLGFLASLCAKAVGDGQVHTYEANPALEPIILRNFRLNGVAPRLEMGLLGEDAGSTTFWLVDTFWSSSVIRRHPSAKPIQVPVKRFNDERERIRPSFLIVDIEGGEHELIRYARLDDLRKVCIELHPHVIGRAAVTEVEAFFDRQGFVEDRAVSGPVHKLYLRDARI